MTEAAIPSRYIFSGVVHPERADVHISAIPMEILAPDGSFAKLTCKVGSSQIAAIVETAQVVSDLYTLKNYVADAVRAVVDVLGYVNGCAYDVEIRQVIEPISGKVVVFGVGIPVLEKYGDRSHVSFIDVLNLFSDKRGQYLQRALSDLRESIASAKDSGFFCYRAVETLRQFFVAEKGAKDGPDSWEFLRRALDVDRSELDEIKRFADPVRHGGSIPISDSERAKVLSKTWDVVRRFVVYAKRGYARRP